MHREPTPGHETVFVTGDQGLLAVAKSILDSEGILWFAAGEQTQMPSAYHASPQFVELQVPTEHAKRGKELLQHLTEERTQGS